MFPDAVKVLKARKKALVADRRVREERLMKDYRDFLTISIRHPHLLAQVAGHEIDIEAEKDLRKATLEEAGEWNAAELNRIDRYLRSAQKPGKGGITPDDIARAKAFPIEELIEITRRDGFVNCIFHGEKTPSMKIYRKENRWWCYGACASGGDVIDYVVRSEGIDFVEAVKKLVGK